jgi:hypothetical protein
MSGLLVHYSVTLCLSKSKVYGRPISLYILSALSNFSQQLFERQVANHNSRPQPRVVPSLMELMFASLRLATLLLIYIAFSY